MERLRKGREEKGVLSMIDGVIFALIILLVTFFLFQQFGGALTQKRELEGTDLRYEAAQDIQKVVLDSIIQETGYLNKSGSSTKEINFSNISVERVLRNYLYLKHKEEVNDGINYDLSRLKRDIKQRYGRCAWDVSHYHFSVSSSYRSSKLFVSDNCDGHEDMPSDRSASQSTITIEMSRVQVILYVWR